MILKFEKWLINQQYRDDLIGDLARVLSMQNIDRKLSRRKSDEHKNWVEIVIGIAEPLAAARGGARGLGLPHQAERLGARLRSGPLSHQGARHRGARQVGR